MKILMIGTAVAALSISACSNDNSKPSDVTNNRDTAQTHIQTAPGKQPLNQLITAYLQLKNALANDNGKEAADAGKQMTGALETIDETSFTPEQKKVYDDVKEDAKEHAEHISDNADKIEHQREHFEILSADLYDLVKAVKPDQTLYLVHCPMYNNNKGANWLSEEKKIKNPYLGKKMQDCGTIKEEIK